MSTPDQLTALRAHLDSALSGAGSRLPGDAAPVLLQTARRRTRSKRLAAGAGSAVVVAALVVGVGSQIATTAGGKPTVISPQGSLPPSAAATSQPSTPAGTPVSAPTTQPSIAPRAGIQVTAQRSVDPQLLAQPSYTEQVFGSTAIFLGPGASTTAKTPGRLISLDLRTGDETTLVTDLPRPFGGFTEAGGNIYVALSEGGRPVINEYSASDGTAVRTLALPTSVNTDCNPTTSCLSDQVASTRLVGVGKNLLVTTPSGEQTTALITVDLASGATLTTTSLTQQGVQPVGVLGDTAYLATQGSLTSVTAGRGTHTVALTGGDGSGVSAVTPQGLYYTSRSDGGGPNPDVPITLTLRRLDPVTLQVTATSAETLAKGVISSPGVSATVVNKILFTTVGTCSTAPTTDICVQRRNPTTLAIVGTVLRVPAGASDQGGLGAGTDGTPYLSITGPNQQTLDLLGAAPAG